MAAKAYFMVIVAEKHLQNNYQDVLRDLKAISEIKSAERVSGTCDLILKVEVPVSNWVVFVANKLLAKEWVKHLQVLNVEPLGTDDYVGRHEEAFIKAEQ